MKKAFLLVLGVLLFSVGFLFATEADDLLGEYFTEENKSLVKIYKCGDLYCGEIVWLKNPTNADGTDEVDDKNPDPAKRNNKIIGLKLVWGFKYSNNEWHSGKIYNPEDGKTYNCKLNFMDEKKLKVRGSIDRAGILGKTQVWVKKKKTTN